MRYYARTAGARLVLTTLALVLMLGASGCSMFRGGPPPTPLPTITPVPQVIPTWTPIPTATPEPTPTAVAAITSTDCRLGSAFVSDVTIPDNTKVKAGQEFTKTWQLRNTGSCPWGDGYFLVFAGKERMSAPDRVPVPATAPGGTAEISVTFTAPAEVGSHRSDWQMWVSNSEQGERFGTVVYVVVDVE